MPADGSRRPYESDKRRSRSDLGDPKIGAHADRRRVRLNAPFLYVTLMLIATRAIVPQRARVPGHHVIAKFVRCAEALSMPEGRAERADDAEHSARLERVMAGHESASQTRNETADVIVHYNPDIQPGQIDPHVDALVGVVNRCP